MLWSAKSERIVDQAEVASPKPYFGPDGEVEIAAESYWAALDSTAGTLARRHRHVDDLWLCSELHGVIVATPNGEPLTPYISWRDARAATKDASGVSMLDKLVVSNDKFFALTGMNLRPGLPILVLAVLKAQGRLPDAFRLFTLPDWLLWRGGERNPQIHPSLAAGTGIYDINRLQWTEELLALAGLAKNRVETSKTIEAGQVAGRIVLGNRALNVFGCVGDLQSAVAGTGFPETAGLVVNLGTGSQVLRSARHAPAGIERRPAAGGGELSAITHIPSGRALNVFAELLDGSAVMGGGSAFFWKMFSHLKADDVLGARLVVDLNVFEAAWRYQGGGLIRNFHEGEFSPLDVMNSISRSWLEQYALAMDQLDPERRDGKFILTGGLSRRAAFIAPTLSALSHRMATLADTVTGEETLDGLLAIAHNKRPFESVPVIG